MLELTDGAVEASNAEDVDRAAYGGAVGEDAMAQGAAAAAAFIATADRSVAAGSTARVSTITIAREISVTIARVSAIITAREVAVTTSREVTVTIARVSAITTAWKVAVTAAWKVASRTSTVAGRSIGLKAPERPRERPPSPFLGRSGTGNSSENGNKGEDLHFAYCFKKNLEDTSIKVYRRWVVLDD